MVVCTSACCNTRQLSQDYLDLLDDVKGHLRKKLPHSLSDPFS
jgi:hypothetical protein